MIVIGIGSNEIGIGLNSVVIKLRIPYGILGLTISFLSPTHLHGYM
jgi:hypothetical protein